MLRAHVTQPVPVHARCLTVALPGFLLINHRDSAAVFNLQACLELDYSVGLNVRDAPWPRLRQGLEAADPLPWDLLFALALIDARCNDGSSDPFWAEYVAAYLPLPETLTLPFCQPQAALAALQHPRVADAAMSQQARLAAAFPELATPARTPLGAGANRNNEPEHPTHLEWGLACVRSRAFQLGPSRFAYVPFLDLANHAAEPNASFRAAGSGAAASVELVATEDVAAGDEVTISYTGAGGATNRRLLVQYGFVEDANGGDRLDLNLTEGYAGTTPLRGNPCGPHAAVRMHLGQHSVRLRCAAELLHVSAPTSPSCLQTAGG